MEHLNLAHFNYVKKYILLPSFIIFTLMKKILKSIPLHTVEKQ